VEALVSGGAFWAGRRVLVTGHNSFKGSWLTLWLTMLGARVSGYALAPCTQPALWNLLGLAQEVKSVMGDVRDAALVERAVADARPQVIFHLAAQALVRASYQDPVGTYATNVMGTVHVLDAARRCADTQAVVVVTSDKCYENRESGQAYREGDAMGGYDPYSSSKGCAELVTAAYRRSFFAKGAGIASARAGNVIGGGDWAAERLVPDLIRAAKAGQATPIRNPKATRPWQHVLEPLSGYMALGERVAQDPAGFAGGWNFGPDEADAVPVEKVADAVVAHWGAPARWTKDGAEQPHEAHYLMLDSSKARAQLGWRPRLGLDDALAWTVQWYKAQAGGADARALCRSQIEQYQQRAAR
jgi:CDP-glucose 4,6-dehydratase